MSQPTPPTARRARLVRLAGSLLALALLVYLLSQQGWAEILTALKNIAPWRLALAMGLMLISRLAVTGRWYALLRSARMPLTVRDALRITFAGLFANNFLPTTVGGDVVRLGGTMQLGLDAAVCAASLVVDRLVGMAGMAMVLPFGLPSLFQNGAPAALGAHSLAALTLGDLGRAAWEKGRRIVERLFSTAVLWLKQPQGLLLSLAFSWVHMLCVFAFLSLVFTGMGEPVPFWLIAGLYSIVYLVTLAPISINGYGVQELSMTFVFTHFAGASLAASLTAALLFRTFMMAASLPGAFFVPGMMPGAGTKETH